MIGCHLGPLLLILNSQLLRNMSFTIVRAEVFALGKSGRRAVRTRYEQACDEDEEAYESQRAKFSPRLHVSAEQPFSK